MVRNDRILLAGATGAVGQRLSKLLVADGWEVVGTTRSAAKTAQLRNLGVQPVIVDVFDADALNRVVGEVQPAIVIHQLTDLPYALDPAQLPEALVRNARLRDIGTRNLVAAAVRAGTRRLIAQSIAFAYAPGPLPYSEEAPLNPASRGVISLETQVLAAPLEGIVLRYGRFYGPGTGVDSPPAGGPLHVDAAADAARRAVTKGVPGLYNIAEDDGTVSSQKAKTVLGWNPGFRLP
ncbi:NAD-dependent epimerase/dehydratase family protein [Larkinella bovis]|uniref:NAD-dependent epimerase/dehydratase family protein n=1 Tax=Larkinella bovis TaxID=683041 RepID=A0ABW0IES0_9BACT